MLIRFFAVLICLLIIFSTEANAKQGKTAGFFIEGDYILWKPWQDDLDYVGEITTPIGVTPPEGKIHSIDYKWESGFKAATKFRICGYKRDTELHGRFASYYC